MSENFRYLRLIVIKLWIFKIAKVKIVPNFLHGLCIPEHYASKRVKESNQDKEQCYSTNIYNTKQLIKK